jgi:hypothetical protein
MVRFMGLSLGLSGPTLAASDEKEMGRPAARQ